MLGKQKLMAFIATRNGARAREFYEKILGLKVTSDEEYALVLEANGTMIRVQKTVSFIPHPFTALGWEVSDIGAMVELLRERGVKLETFSGLDQDDRGIWHTPDGAQVAWFKDPDGNTLSLTQF
jgi:catechol 2,3-dioxygenase-like lactoylglutathione lyase family enzyme